MQWGLAEICRKQDKSSADEDSGSLTSSSCLDVAYFDESNLHKKFTCFHFLFRVTLPGGNGNIANSKTEDKGPLLVNYRTNSPSIACLHYIYVSIIKGSVWRELQ